MRSKTSTSAISRHCLQALVLLGAGAAQAGCVSLAKGGPYISDDVWLLNPPSGAAATTPSGADGTPNGSFVPAACPRTEADVANFNTSTQINNCVFAMINLIDVRYQVFENQLFSSTTNTNFVTDLAVLGLNSAGTFGSNGVSQILNAISGGLTGAKSTFDTDVLYSKTISVVIQQMRADRATQLKYILQRVNTANANTSAGSPINLQSIKSQADLDAAVTSATKSAASRAATAAAQTVASAANAADPTKGAAGAGQAASDAVPTAATTGTAAATGQAVVPYRSMYEAAIDLHEYAIYGSWTHALIALESTTSSNAEAAKADVNATKTGTTAPAKKTTP